MLNPGSAFASGSYPELRGRVLQQLRSARINDRLFELIEAACNGALADDDLVLSAPEKRRLLADVLKAVLGEMNGKLGGA